jgi:hypothetical protein
VTGFPFNRAAIAVALGESRPGFALDRASAFSPAAVTKFLVASAGELVAVHGVDDAAAIEGVEYVRIYRRPGQVIEPLRRGADRAGAILAVGGTREQALGRAGAAAALVRFEVA